MTLGGAKSKLRAPTAMLAGVSTAMVAGVTRFAKLSVKGLGGRLVSEA